MLIYQAPSDRFIDDVRGNTIYYRKNLPSPCSVVPIAITIQEQKEKVCIILFIKI